jgi:hypothetical protein
VGGGGGLFVTSPRGLFCFLLTVYNAVTIFTRYFSKNLTVYLEIFTSAGSAKNSPNYADNKPVILHKQSLFYGGRFPRNGTGGWGGIGGTKWQSPYLQTLKEPRNRFRQPI